MKSTQPVLPSSTDNTDARRPPTDASNTGSPPFRGWMLLPLRLFLGLTFIYAGIQKLTDPQYFNNAAVGYIGKQIQGFAQGSPLHDFLLNVALPHATLFGWLVVLGEIAVGLGTLCGFLFRPAAFFGLLLSTTFFLTASWGIYPYFFGSDIVFMICWLTLILTGPLPTGMPSLDGWLLPRLPQNSLSRLISRILIGTGTPPSTELIASGLDAHQRRFSLAEQHRRTRRTFLAGAAAGGAVVLGLTLMGFVLRVFSRPVVNVSGNSPTSSTPSPATATPTTTTTPGATATPAGQVIAQASAVPQNSAVTFTLANGDPGVLIHLSNDQFVAYDATCTHRQCPVTYDPESKYLVCPCHGSQFDPANQATVLRPPASAPLTPVAIHVDSASGAITLAQS